MRHDAIGHLPIHCTYLLPPWCVTATNGRIATAWSSSILCCILQYLLEWNTKLHSSPNLACLPFLDPICPHPTLTYATDSLQMDPWWGRENIMGRDAVQLQCNSSTLLSTDFLWSCSPPHCSKWEYIGLFYSRKSKASIGSTRCFKTFCQDRASWMCMAEGSKCTPCSTRPRVTVWMVGEHLCPAVWEINVALSRSNFQRRFC